MIRTLSTLMILILSAQLAAADMTVIDGDTLDLNGTRYRLNGIDAPEWSQSCKSADGHSWPCGIAATEMMAALTQGKEVACKTLGQDIYGRNVATCTADGTDLGRLMVVTGMAWAYTKYSDAYTADQASAKAAERGIWQGPATPAWEFRQQKRNKAAIAAAAKAAAKAGTAGSGDCRIKGNISSNGRIYHLPGSEWYAKTRINTSRGERWFCTEEKARKAGWRRARNY
jgi:endonuclease YncB( thermonuclease family)